MKYTYIDCYNNGITVTDNSNHDDPEFDNFVTIIHIAYLYLPSTKPNRVEIVIRDHDDINNPSFYILSEDRSKELYRVSLFDNSYTEGLSKEDKEILNRFIQYEYSDTPDKENIKWDTIFNTMKSFWELLNDEDNIYEYDSIIDPPSYI